ncbi:MAG TPA: permease-like cell division protein FtsX [Cyclobacteriaceae bacterium]|mgnify:CR=1 FL=1|nr:permease-like cell division protein FtsX [Cyclobacteriaceae bacterium]
MEVEKPQSRRKKKLGSYPSFSVIFSITLALFVIGLFGMLIIFANQMEKLVRENVKVQVYLNSNLTDAQRLQIEKNLSARSFILLENEQPSITYISKDEAAEKFIADTGEDFRQFLGDNPLRDAFLVGINPEHHSKSAMDEIKKEIEAISGVYQVFYVESLIESINQNVTKIALVLLGIGLVLLLVVMLLINNTVKLALFSQRFLIRSMQLVGATRWFIQKPFLLRSLFYGFAGGIIAVLMIIGLLRYATGYVEEISMLQNKELMLMLFASLILIGITLASLSSYRAMRKYLGMSLDELY